MTTETIYIAPGYNMCRVYAMPYPMRKGQHPRDIEYQYQMQWREIGMLNHKLEPVYWEPDYIDVRDEASGCMGGTFFTRNKG